MAKDGYKIQCLKQAARTHPGSKVTPMKQNNAQILLNVRDTMRLMLTSAESDNWEKVTLLDKERTDLLSGLSDNEYTGDLELIDEIVKLDQKILETAEKAKSSINEKVAMVCRAKGIHSEYQTIADL